MERKIQIIILFLVILLAVSLFVIFNVQSQKSALEVEYNQIRERLNRENEQLLGQMNSALEENKYLKERLEALHGDLESTSSQRDELQQRFKLVDVERKKLLEKLQNYAQLQKELETFKKENETLQDELSALGKRNSSLETELNKLQAANQSLKQEIEEAKHILKEKTLMAGYVKEQERNKRVEPAGIWSIDLPPIVVSPQTEPDINSSSLLMGKILHVDTEYNFVVIDLGQETGIAKGMLFEVFRGDRFLGKLEVIQLRDAVAACDIIQANTPFRKGDTIRY